MRRRIWLRGTPIRLHILDRIPSKFSFHLNSHEEFLRAKICITSMTNFSLKFKHHLPLSASENLAHPTSTQQQPQSNKIGVSRWRWYHRRRTNGTKMRRRNKKCHNRTCHRRRIKTWWTGRWCPRGQRGQAEDRWALRCSPFRRLHRLAARCASMDGRWTGRRALMWLERF